MGNLCVLELVASLKAAWKLTITPPANELGKQKGAFIHPYGYLNCT